MRLSPFCYFTVSMAIITTVRDSRSSQTRGVNLDKNSRRDSKALDFEGVFVYTHFGIFFNSSRFFISYAPDFFFHL